MAIIAQTHRKMLSAQKKHSLAQFEPGQAALVLRLDLVEDAIYRLLNFFLGELKHGLHSAPIPEEHRSEIRVATDPKSSARSIISKAFSNIWPHYRAEASIE